MGVPSFFVWLAKRYPRILVDVLQENARVVNGVEVPVDATKPNPNNIEFDNLYLDMNGIIHPCVHPEGRPAPPTEEAMVLAIFDYIDFIFNMVRPRKLLYMAIDGVAPRAKMNQQRSRRFKSIREAGEHAEAERQIWEAMKKEMEKRGVPIPVKEEKGERFDSNCITPGTAFMAKIATGLSRYAMMRVSQNAAWRGVNVIVSDATVPGEGEHKIMEFIRISRTYADYDPNTRHCIYGLDADLIMLALATHEAHFTILREVVFFRNRNQCNRCGQEGHQSNDCQGVARNSSMIEGYESHIEKRPFQFLSIPILRQYLEHDLRPEGKCPFAWDLERALDDFVFLCFLVGNDFLPHLPTLSIREGAIDMLMALYKEMLPGMGGYITNNGSVNAERAGALIGRVGELEDRILQNRIVDEKRNRSRQKRRRLDKQRAKQLAATASLSAASSGGDDDDDDDDEAIPTSFLEAERERRREAVYEKEVEDAVQLGTSGWATRYYRHKFDALLNSGEETYESLRRKISEQFFTGMAWVLRYYYHGCVDWEWYFPYHYAPFAQDIATCIDWRTFRPTFNTEAQPFKPLEQLMAVLPPQSSWCLPPPYAKLMTDARSPLVEYYPEEIELDMDGARWTWQGVAQLPFIDAALLRGALTECTEQLTQEERVRNSRGKVWLVVSKTRGLPVPQAGEKKHFDDARTNLRGLVCFEADEQLSDPLPPLVPGGKAVANCALRFAFELPEVDAAKFKWGILPGAIVARDMLSQQDLVNRHRFHRGAAARIVIHRPSGGGGGYRNSNNNNNRRGGYSGGAPRHQQHRRDNRGGTLHGYINTPGAFQPRALNSAPGLLPTPPQYQQQQQQQPQQRYPPPQQQQQYYQQQGGHHQQQQQFGPPAHYHPQQGYPVRPPPPPPSHGRPATGYDRRKASNELRDTRPGKRARAAPQAAAVPAAAAPATGGAQAQLLAQLAQLQQLQEQKRKIAEMRQRLQNKK